MNFHSANHSGDWGGLPQDHEPAARGTAQFGRLAAERYLRRRPRSADNLGATLLSRLLPARTERASAHGHRSRGPRHHGRALLGSGRKWHAAVDRVSQGRAVTETQASSAAPFISFPTRGTARFRVNTPRIPLSEKALLNWNDS